MFPIKPKMVLIGINGSKYKIKEVFPEIQSFSYFFKEPGDWFWEYKGVISSFVLEEQFKLKNILPPTKAGKILYGTNNP